MSETTNKTYSVEGKVVARALLNFADGTSQQSNLLVDKAWLSQHKGTTVEMDKVELRRKVVTSITIL